MPAYRSEAEAEIRVEVVKRLREIIPGCRIIHEINAASFGNRIDVMAVGEDRIAAVEIKSAKDKLDRLPKQIKAMNTVAHHVFAALHEKFLEDNRHLGPMPPDEARNAVVWIYPRANRGRNIEVNTEWASKERWAMRKHCLPSGALGMLWREELQAICAGLGLKGVSKLNMPEAQDAILWAMTGQELTRTICATLRARKCVEADPPIGAIAAEPHADLLTGTP